jgi:hypothetical protein
MANFTEFPIPYVEFLPKNFAATWTELTPTGVSPAVTVTVPLDMNAYFFQIPAGGIDVIAYTLPANDATGKQYGATLRIAAPAASTEEVTIPSGWGNLGSLGSISLTAGDEPMFMALETDNDNDTAPTINFSLAQREVIA